MQNQERELITGLFGRLQPFESQPRDAEADALIRDLAARQPASAYLLVQTVLVQEQALKAAQERIAELEAKHGAKPGSVLSPSATPKANEARLEAYCRVRALRDARGRHRFTYPAMAEMFDRHHTTISTAITKYASRYEVSA